MREYFACYTDTIPEIIPFAFKNKTKFDVYRMKGYNIFYSESGVDVLIATPDRYIIPYEDA